MKFRAEKKKICVFFACLLLCFPMLLQWALPVNTASNDCYKTVRVGYYSSSKFMEGDGKSVPRSGYGYEYLQKVVSYTGWKYEYVEGSWSELYQKLKTGEIDLMPGVAYSAERGREVLFPEYEMLKETFYIYKDADDTSMQSGVIASYAGKKIGVIQDAKMTDCVDRWLAQTHAHITTVLFEDLEACAQAFNRHEIDGFVSADNIVSGYTGISPVELLGREPYYICAAKGRTDLLDELNTALALINGQDSIYLANLKNKYSADTSISIFLSQQERKWMEAHPQITVGYLDNYMPYCAEAPDGTPKGMFRDTLNDLFAALPGGYIPEINYISYDNHDDMVAALKQQQVDLIFPVSGEFSYAEKNGYQQSSVIMQAAVDLVYADAYADDKFSRIAVNRNNRLQSEFTEMNYGDADLIYYDSVEECIRALKRNQVGSTMIEALRAVSLVGEDEELQAVPLHATCDFCFGVYYGNSDLLRILNHGISMLGDEYGLSHAYQYLGDVVTDSVKGSVRRYLVFFGLLLLFCLGGVLLIRYQSLRRLSEAETAHNLELRNALMQAHQASYAKRVFLNNISHDLRTPLNAILGMIEINRKSTDPQIIAENRRKTRLAVDQLLTMTNHMIEVSKLESGDILDMRENVDLAAVIREVESNLSRAAEQAGLDFQHRSADFNGEWPYVYSNTSCMKEILQHILDNAVKYNRPNGKITWEDRLEKKSEQTVEYCCTITDTGIGMKPDFLKQIFEPFSQERYDARTAYRGSGLGMAITKNLINQMNGSINIDSRENFGTTVHIRIPLEICTEQVQPVPETVPSEPVDEPQGENLSGVRILLVEDNELNIEISQFLLEDAGAKVTVARDGQQAVDAYENAEENAFDVVLMDIMMPVMNGYEATRVIRASTRKDAKTIPIIAVTACVEEDAKKECEETGFSDYLAKPLDMQKLMQTVLRLLAEK